MTNSNIARKFMTLALAGVMTLPCATAGVAISKELTTGSVTRYANAARLTTNAIKASRVGIKAASSTLKSGLTALDRKNTKSASIAYHKLRKGTLERKLMGWSLARKGEGLDVATLVALEQQVLDWPGLGLIRKNIEKALIKSGGSSSLRVAFSASAPLSVDAAIALAIAHKKVGATSKARKAIYAIWRKKKLSKAQETKILKSVGSVLSRDDHRARIDYLFKKTPNSRGPTYCRARRCDTIGRSARSRGTQAKECGKQIGRCSRITKRRREFRFGQGQIFTPQGQVFQSREIVTGAER